MSYDLIMSFKELGILIFGSNVAIPVIKNSFVKEDQSMQEKLNF